MFKLDTGKPEAYASGLFSYEKTGVGKAYVELIVRYCQFIDKKLKTL